MVSFYNKEKFDGSIVGIDLSFLYEEIKRIFRENGYDIDVTFVDNDLIRKINKKYRGIDSPTDVLSFEPVIDIKDPKADVFVSVDFIKEVLGLDGMDLVIEVTRMIIHGILHVMGHDHLEVFSERNASQEKMYLEQERLLNVVLEQVKSHKL